MRPWHVNTTTWYKVYADAPRDRECMHVAMYGQPLHNNAPVMLSGRMGGL